MSLVQMKKLETPGSHCIGHASRLVMPGNMPSEVNETMESFSFYQWLKTQIERKDIIGDFAHTISQFDEPQTTRKKANGHMIWATWLIDKNASPAVIEAFNLAWNEYQHQVRPS